LHAWASCLPVIRMALPIPPLTDRLLGDFLEKSSTYAFLCMDPQGVIVGWLGAAQKIFGFTPEDVVGKTAAQIFVPDDREKALDRYELEVAVHQGFSEDDRWHLRKDNSRIWVTGTVTALYDENGQLLGFVKCVRDRTDLRTQHESVEARAAELADSRERTHAFLKTLGHELRNPLAPLSNAVHIISRASSDPRVATALQIISRQISTLTRLADDLMDISRLEIGKVTLELKRVDVRRLLLEAATSLQDAAKQKSLSLEAILPQGPLFAEIDEDRFQRVVLNLVGNAIKYTPAQGRIWVTATEDAHEVLIHVQDTGIGIAPDVLPKIFELFTRASAAVDLVPGGLGVGLAMVKDIVELHGGTVQARSAGPGKGSEFTVRIPAAG
jgi:PAS domain S-box-containing protein